jgi:hypothetical protein
MSGFSDMGIVQSLFAVSLKRLSFRAQSEESAFATRKTRRSRESAT